MKLAAFWTGERGGRIHLAAALIVSLAVTLTACARMISVPYVPTGITTLPQLESLAVYRFADKRDEEPTRIGGAYGLFRDTTRRFYSEEPASITVSRAFVSALKVRGFTVIDMTGETFVPRVSNPQARVAMHGEVREFWTEIHWVYRAKCAVLVQLYDVGSGRKLWERLYAARDSKATPVFALEKTIREGAAAFLGEQLAKVLSQVVNDPELFSYIGRP